MSTAERLPERYLAKKPGFEAKYDIFRAISKPRTLSGDIPGGQKGVYL